MKRDLNREKIIAHCLSLGFRKDNIEYMDWNTVDWHLKDKGLPKIFMVHSTMGDRYGFIMIGGREYEYFVYLKKITVKQMKSGDRNGLPSSVTAVKGTE
jgi:hypothetical protein